MKHINEFNGYNDFEEVKHDFREVEEILFNFRNKPTHIKTINDARDIQFFLWEAVKEINTHLERDSYYLVPIDTTLRDNMIKKIIEKINIFYDQLVEHSLIEYSVEATDKKENDNNYTIRPYTIRNGKLKGVEYAIQMEFDYRIPDSLFIFEGLAIPQQQYETLLKIPTYLITENINEVLDILTGDVDPQAYFDAKNIGLVE